MDDERLVAHLQMIQGVINRLAANSFSIKGLALTAVAGLAAVAFSTANAPILYIGAVAGTFFGLLDGYYLYLERKYIALFNRVRKGDLPTDTGPYTLDYRLCCSKDDYLPGAFSWPFFLFYLVLAAASLALINLCPTGQP